MVLTVDLISWFPTNKHLTSLMQWHLGLLSQMSLQLVIRSAEEMQLQTGRVPSRAAGWQDCAESCLRNVDWKHAPSKAVLDA